MVARTDNGKVMEREELPLDFQTRIDQILPQRPSAAFEARLWQSLRINTLKISIEALLAILRERKIDFYQVDFCPYVIVVTKAIGSMLVRSDLATQGFLYAQGLESLLPVIVLDPKAGQRVLDVCAAPGSKTSQIAMHMGNQGFLKANEPIRDRLYRLKSVLALMGAKAQVSSIDGRRIKEEQLFDRVLVDVPCSCEGRFVKDEPKSFAYWSVRKIKEMSHKQKGLLMNASRLLTPEGILVYATCTYAPEENEEVVDWFLRKSEGRFKCVPIELPGILGYPTLKEWHGRVYEPDVHHALRVLPDERMEGFFIAKFIKSNYK